MTATPRDTPHDRRHSKNGTRPNVRAHASREFVGQPRWHVDENPAEQPHGPALDPPRKVAPLGRRPERVAHGAHDHRWPVLAIGFSDSSDIARCDYVARLDQETPCSSPTGDCDPWGWVGGCRWSGPSACAAHGSISHNDVRPSVDCVEATFGGLRKVADTALSFAQSCVSRRTSGPAPRSAASSARQARPSARRCLPRCRRRPSGARWAARGRQTPWPRPTAWSSCTA